jgi:predicted nucleic-acid-binding Zn-ribbon protein
MKIPNWSWRRPRKHNKEENNGEDCQHIEFCLYRYKDGSFCGKPGCVGWWKDPVYSTDGMTYKVLRIQHAHYIVDSYAQGRNTSHVIRQTRTRCSPIELQHRTFLKGKLKIPDHIIDMFSEDPRLRRNQRLDEFKDWDEKQ